MRWLIGPEPAPIEEPPYPKPTAKDLEIALIGQVYFAKRVTYMDPRHAEFHAEINLLLDEWEELRYGDLTPVAPTE